MIWIAIYFDDAAEEGGGKCWDRANYRPYLETIEEEEFLEE